MTRPYYKSQLRALFSPSHNIIRCIFQTIIRLLNDFIGLFKYKTAKQINHAPTNNPCILTGYLLNVGTRCNLHYNRVKCKLKTNIGLNTRVKNKRYIIHPYSK